MKIRNVKIVADLKGMDKKYQPLYLKIIEHMVKTFESSHWDDSWVQVTKRYKTRMEGELNSRIKKLSDKELALLIFNKIETDADGIEWHIITDYDIDTYNGPSNVIGYGMPGDDITRVNIDFLVGDDINSLKDLRDGGSNLTHEKFHDRGASHDSKSTARRPNSAAYLSGTVYSIAHDIVFKEAIADVGPIKPGADVTPTVPDTTQPPVVVTNPKPPVKRICYRPWWGFGLITKCYNE